MSDVTPEPNRKRLTDHIEAYRREGRTEDLQVLMEAYMAELAGFIRAKIPDFATRRDRPSDIAIQAFEIAGRKIRQQEIENSRHFWGLLRGIAKNLISEAIRNNTRGKRDLRRETGLNDTNEGHATKKKLSDGEAAVIVAKAVFDETDLEKMKINVMGICMDMSSTQIAEVLELEHEDPYSPRTIMAQIKKTKKRIAEKLVAGGYGYEVDEDE